MLLLDVICSALARLAPLDLAESWDNVGLLVGDRAGQVTRVMTCLTITPNVVDEAVDDQAGLIVTHHPLPFKPLSRLTTDTIAGRLLLRLIRANVAVYSAHTAYDSALQGINQAWAEQLDLQGITPLITGTDGNDALGSGRYGKLVNAITLHQLVRQAADTVGATAPRLVGDPNQVVRKVAFACGSGGSFLAAARRRGCDALITGEATFHTALEAETLAIGLGLLGHYWSERFAMERLAEQLAHEFPEVDVWASRRERDPLQAV